MWLPFFFFSFPVTDLISINPANTFMVRILASSGDFSLRECYACRTSAFAFWLCYDLMVVCSVRNPIQQRRWPPENSYQWHEVTKGKKRENTRFNEVRQFAYILGARRESSYWINKLQITGFSKVTNIGDATPPYIDKETTKKRKPKPPIGSETNSKSDLETWPLQLY